MPRSPFIFNQFPPPFGYAGVAGSEQARQERDKGRADEYHTTTGHQLLDSLALGTGIVIAVPLHEVDHAPHGKASITERW